MNGPFGLDHPLLATHDIEGLRTRLIALGFNMTAIGKHPWGTSTSVAVFDGCLLEIMGIYDPTLIDEVPVGDFHFGRHVYEHLQIREGVALTALHSNDSYADAQRATAAGFQLAGHLEFGRDVVLPDGTAGRTKTTLALLPDPYFPRLSLFLCQQHRPDLIYVPEWLNHPNSVTKIRGVNIIAPPRDHAALTERFQSLYGDYENIVGGITFETANGALQIMEAEAFNAEIGPLPKAALNDQAPFIAGMDFTMTDPEKLRCFLNSSKLNFDEGAMAIRLTDAQETANTVLRFFKSD